MFNISITVFFFAFSIFIFFYSLSPFIVKTGRVAFYRYVPVPHSTIHGTYAIFLPIPQCPCLLCAHKSDVAGTIFPVSLWNGWLSGFKWSYITPFLPSFFHATKLWRLYYIKFVYVAQENNPHLVSRCYRWHLLA